MKNMMAEILAADALRLQLQVLDLSHNQALGLGPCFGHLKDQTLR